MELFVLALYDMMPCLQDYPCLFIVKRVDSIDSEIYAHEIRSRHVFIHNAQGGLYTDYLLFH